MKLSKIKNNNLRFIHTVILISQFRGYTLYINLSVSHIYIFEHLKKLDKSTKGHQCCTKQGRKYKVVKVNEIKKSLWLVAYI